MIIEYQCAQTERIWRGLASRAFPAYIQQIARRKLRMIAAAVCLADLECAPDNMLQSAPSEMGRNCLLHICSPYYLFFELQGGNAQCAQIKECLPCEERQAQALLRNVSPGEILQEEFLLPLDISPSVLAQKADIDYRGITRLIQGKDSLTAEMALRLAAFLGTTPHFWLNLQAEYDLEELSHSLQLDLQVIPRYNS